MDKRPAFYAAHVAGLPVGVVGFHGEAGIDDEVQRGFVGEADTDGAVFAGGKDLGRVNGLAFDLFHDVKAAVAVTADGGLAELGFGEAQGGGEAFQLFTFFGAAMFAW